jgi:hypothetical protein
VLQYDIYIYKFFEKCDEIYFPFVAAFYTPFFKEVWEKKPEIEQAFHMEEPINFTSGESTLEMPPRQPRPPPRHESYHIKAGSNEG